MAIASVHPLKQESFEARNRRTIEALVSGYATQDIGAIMPHFSEDAVYCDILGKGRRGDEYHGKPAIERAIKRQFEIGGIHTYTNSKIVVAGPLAFASWTLQLGDPGEPSCAHFEGIDEFELNELSQVTVKKAWLKGQVRLRSETLKRNPLALFRHVGFALHSLAG
jgi:ketosteroid isomerase-like protein